MAESACRALGGIIAKFKKKTELIIHITLLMQGLSPSWITVLGFGVIIIFKILMAKHNGQ